MHVMKVSEVVDNCCRYALSNGRKRYSSPCTHSHNKTCKKCEDPETVLVSLTEISSTICYENDDQKDDTFYIVSEVQLVIKSCHTTLDSIPPLIKWVIYWNHLVNP